MATLLEALNDALQSAVGPGPPAPPEVLVGLDDKLAQLGQISVAWGANGIDDWLTKFQQLFDDQAIRDSFLVRFLQLRFPRVAEALTIAGVFSIDYSATGVHAFHIDQARLNGFLQSPGATAADPNYWFSKLQKIADVKLAQVYLSMLLLAPRQLIAFEYEKKGFAALPSPGDAGVSLQELIGLVNSPLRAKLPVTPPLDFAAFKSQIDNTLPTDYVAFTGPDGDPTNPVDPADPLAGIGFELKLATPQQTFGNKSLDLGNGWQATFATKASANGLYKVVLVDGGISQAAGDGSNADAEIRVARSAGGKIVVGPDNGTRFEIGNAALGLLLNSALESPSRPRFGITASLEQLALVLRSDVLGPVASALPLPGEIRFSTDVKLSYLQGAGFQSQGSAGGQPPLGAQFIVPLGLNVGTSSLGLKIDRVLVRLEFALPDRTYQVQMRFGAAGQLGPIKLTIDEAGAWVGRLAGQAGGALPPAGIGLTLDAGPISGGGFLKAMPPREYGGALQLKILGIGAFAYSIFGSLPSGDTTFVALIGIRFPPPGIQLGFGFAISGFGGLIGINRRADTDMLRERFASGAAGNVLFNDDPTANAPMLLAELGRFFPGEAGVFTVGPTFQINWLELLRLDLGVFIELPGPRKIFIAGSARMVIGASEDLALIYLRLDFIGGIDFTKELIFFDASLINSHVIHIFKLTGDSALRIKYGANGYFLFSAGGFHPSFNPGPMEVPRLARVGSSMSLDVAIANIWLKQAMYLALTSNTFQLGGLTEAGIEIGPISAHGWFGFDALVQFEPFHFVATIDAGFDVEFEGISLCGVNVSGQFSGPGPLTIEARASVKILFVRHSEHVTITLGGSPSDQPVPISDVIGRIYPEIAKVSNLRAEVEDRSVIFRAIDPLPFPIVSPIGALIWEQRRVPFGLEIQRLEGAPLDGTHRLQVEADDLASDPERDWFGVGTYRVLSDPEALNNARLTEEQSGLRVGKGEHLRPAEVPCDITIDLILLPKRAPFPGLLVGPYLSQEFLKIQVEVDRIPKVEGGGPRITVGQEQWNVASAQTGQVDEVTSSPVQAFFVAKRSGKVAVASTDAAVELAGVFA